MTDRGSVVIGVGNVLYGDEGLGVHVLHRLRRSRVVPPGLELLDCGALGWDLLRHLEGVERAWIVDAIAAEQPEDVGSIYAFSPSDVPGAIRWGKLSSHEWELLELLWAAEAMGELPPTTLIVMAIDPDGVIRHGLEPSLSATVRERVPILEGVVVEHLEAAGWSLDRRSGPPLSDPTLDDIVRTA